MIWFYWITGILLALIWLVPTVQLALHSSEVADLNQSRWNPPHDAVLPSLTIVVPARNEEAEIESALRSLLQLNYPQFEVVAVNDRSTDHTGAIMDRIAAEPAAQDRLRVIHVRDLPAGWLGKVHAMWLGSQRNATQRNAAQPGGSDWLLFTDADCVFHADCLRRAIHYATTTATDHLVLFPTAHMKTLGERMMISFPQVMASFAMRPWKVRDPSARDHIGVGAFNLIRRSAYNAIGTYEALRLEVVDDIKLGEAIKKAGLRQDVVFGHELVSLRWAVGAAGVVANLEKNLFAFLKFRVSLVLGVCAVTFFLCVCPFLGLLLAPGWARAPFAVAVTMIALAYTLTGRYMASSPLLFLTCPIAALAFDFATLQSAFIALRDGAITWRGTKYSLEELRKKS
ncbi:MAG TPA: glycosyltransferase family 2 protein [Candidatus Angelobacter sp.]|jgi:glycosyltransferase involved in cell wall biosynthesis|nr:glycosyltransferase family 2 protein [Candidatus Angelobacter sp.]